jgi:ankyrin repeat protein
MSLHQALENEDYAEVLNLIALGTPLDTLNHLGETALAVAVWKANASILRLLLQNGADPNDSKTLQSAPLHCAIIYNRTDIVRLLLEYKADLSFRASSISHATPLETSVLLGYVEITRLLLDAGADVNADSFAYFTILYAAATSRSANAEVVQTLVDAGASLNSSTALQAAAECGHVEIVRVLLLAHALKFDSMPRDSDNYDYDPGVPYYSLMQRVFAQVSDASNLATCRLVSKTWRMNVDTSLHARDLDFFRQF